MYVVVVIDDDETIGSVHPARTKVLARLIQQEVREKQNKYSVVRMVEPYPQQSGA